MQGYLSVVNNMQGYLFDRQNIHGYLVVIYVIILLCYAGISVCGASYIQGFLSVVCLKNPLFYVLPPFKILIELPNNYQSV